MSTVEGLERLMSGYTKGFGGEYYSIIVLVFCAQTLCLVFKGQF